MRFGTALLSTFLLTSLSLGAWATTGTLEAVQKKWLPEYFKPSNGGPSGFNQLPDPPEAQEEANEPNEVLIMEITPLKHLVRLSVFGHETFFEFTVGKGGKNSVKLVSFDKDYRAKLMANSMRLVQAKVATLSAEDAQRLRSAIADGVPKEDMTWFDPYCVLRFNPGAHFYARVESSGIHIDPELFAYSASKVDLRWPKNMNEIRQSYAYWPSTVLGAGTPTFLYGLHTQFNTKDSTIGWVFGLAVLGRPIAQAVYDNFFLGIYAHLHPRLRRLRNQNFINGTLLTGATATALIAGKKLCEVFLK